MTVTRSITASDAKARLGEVLASLATEGPVEITRNGRAIGTLAAPRADARANRALLTALAPRYAAGDIDWRQVADATCASFGELLVELGEQGLRLPTSVASKRPAQQALLDEVLRSAARP